MKNKLLIILALVLICFFTSSYYLSTRTTLPVLEVSTKSNDNKATEYTFDKTTKTLTISIQGKMRYDCDNAPWKDIEYPENIVCREGLTSIPDYGFAFSVHGNGGERLNNNDRIKTVKLPSTIESIGYEAFAFCEKLEKINIPKSVKKIGDSTFDFCESLKEITIPGSVKKLPWGLFHYCENLKCVKIGKGVKKIGSNVFANCKKLKKLSLPDSVIEINDAFSHCNSLKTVKLPKNLKKIKSYTFYSCKKLKRVTIKNKVTEIKKQAIYNCKSLKSIVIPKSVKRIGKYALGYFEKYQPSGDEDYIDAPIKNFTIKGYKGTAAEKYAKKNGFKFVALDS